MTLTTILASLLGIALYLLTGMVLAHHTKLGSKFYPASLTQLTFFWIFPIVGFVVWLIGMLIVFMSEGMFFGEKSGDPGLRSIVDPSYKSF